MRGLAMLTANSITTVWIEAATLPYIFSWAVKLKLRFLALYSYIVDLRTNISYEVNSTEYGR